MPLTTDEKVMALSREVIAAFDKADGGVHPGFRPAHAKVLQAPLKLVQFQLHAPRLLRSSNLHQAASGIARQHREVSPHPPWNQ